MPSILIKNLGALVTGHIEQPLGQADSVYVEDGVIQAVGNGLGYRADTIIDARGITAMPGLIDSHSHPTFGDFTPTQNAVGGSRKGRHTNVASDSWLCLDQLVYFGFESLTTDTDAL